MTEISTFAIQGLGIGALYAIMALPLSLVWSTTGCFDITVGAYAMLGGMAAANVGLPQGLLLALAIGAVLGAGMAACMTALDRTESRTPVNVLIVGFGFLTITESFALWQYGTDPARLNLFDRSWRIAGITVQPQHVISIGLALTLLAITSAILRRTGAGRVMRACAQNHYDAPLVGIAPRMVQSAVLVAAGILGAAAGVLLTVTQGMRYDSGLHLVVSALGALILLGVRGPGSAVAGGLLIGVVEALSSAYAPDAIATAIPLILIVAVLASGRFEAQLAGART